MMSQEIIKKNILLVEDNEDWVYRMELLLNGSFNVVAAQNSTEALALATKNMYDLILLDIMLKGSDLQGDELIVKLKKLQPRVKVIMISCLSKLSVIEKCFEHGARWYITKDADETDIRRRINAALIDRVYLLDYFCDQKLAYNMINDQLDEEGRQSAAIISTFVKIKDPVPAFSTRTILDIFFTPPAYYGEIQIETAPTDIKDRSISARYNLNKNKNELLICDPQNYSAAIVRQLKADEVTYHIVTRIEDIGRMMCKHEIACVLLMCPPRDALFGLRSAKFIDYRVAVTVYNHGNIDSGIAIQLKHDGAYRLLDNITDVPGTVKSMLAGARESFNDIVKYCDLKLAKSYWALGFMAQIKTIAQIKTSASGKSLSGEDFHRIDNINYVIQYESFED